MLLLTRLSPLDVGNWIRVQGECLRSDGDLDTMFALPLRFYMLQWVGLCNPTPYTATKIDAIVAHKAMSLKRHVFQSEQTAPYIRFSFYHRVGQDAKSKGL